MTDYAVDRLVFGPDDVDLTRSPLAGRIDAETFVLGAFNPGLTRLPNGNLLMMVRVAEALREPVIDGHARSIRWEHGHYAIDAWPEDQVTFDDPRIFRIQDDNWRVLALTSISWLLPVELSADGLEVIAVHYDRAIAPSQPYQCYGVEDARISRVRDRWLMTTCSVSPERLSTTLYTSDDAVTWTLEGIILDHQNKDMLIFEGLIGGKYWAQTRPLGDTWFAYPPGAEYRPGPSINLASSPDALHWKPCEMPGLRPHAFTASTSRMGGSTPPILTADGWLTLWHGVMPKGAVGAYRTYWSILDRDEPWRPVRSDHGTLIAPNPTLTAGLEDKMYLHDVVFTSGIADGGDHFVVASGEADLACRITHVPKAAFGL
jgi:predicted GH43/DUF377 family glycosyl hydrolase